MAHTGPSRPTVDATSACQQIPANRPTTDAQYCGYIYGIVVGMEDVYKSYTMPTEANGWPTAAVSYIFV